MNIIPSKANTAFTKVPINEVRFEPLTEHQKMVWIMDGCKLLQQGKPRFLRWRLAKKLGYARSQLQTNNPRADRAGLHHQGWRQVRPASRAKEGAESTESAQGASPKP